MMGPSDSDSPPPQTPGTLFLRKQDDRYVSEEETKIEEGEGRETRKRKEKT